MEEHWNRWQDLVESQGCGFARTIVLRDPLDRFLSNVMFNVVPEEKVSNFSTSRANWMSRYLLFNICGKNEAELEVRCGYDSAGPFTMTPMNFEFFELF